jgi:hypothetical protein
MHINGQELTKNLQKFKNLTTKHGKNIWKWKWRSVSIKVLKNLTTTGPFAYYNQVANLKCPFNVSSLNSRALMNVGIDNHIV